MVAVQRRCGGVWLGFGEEVGLSDLSPFYLSQRCRHWEALVVTRFITQKGKSLTLFRAVISVQVAAMMTKTTMIDLLPGYLSHAERVTH
jgi:hypothetical protein